MIFSLGQTLEEIEADSLTENEIPFVAVVSSQNGYKMLEKAGILYEGDLNLSKIGFCKMETQQDCLAGSLYIPKLLDVLGSGYKILFFINRKHIVIVGDDGFAEQVIKRIRAGKSNQGDTKEKFIYNFITEFMNRDLELLVSYERRLMKMEEHVLNGKQREFQSQFASIRRELLILRGYYDELMDMGKELEENENGFFVKKQLKYFGIISDRADRLMNKTAHLLEYAQQVRDAYQAQIDAKQNNNMQFLTVISTIFFPLTLITGWYGMNFNNMPELRNGYPGVILLSIIVIVVCIVIFKKKKIL